MTETVNGGDLNQKFDSLPKERQRQIINGAMKCFSLHGYEKASMADIAREAGVSKALLFHYFETKKELFLFLWNLTGEETKKKLLEVGVSKDKDFFSAMEKGLKAKMDLARAWPWMALFAIKAWYEKDKEVSGDIAKTLDPFLAVDEKMLRAMYPETKFRDDLDLTVMYKELYYMSEGYIWHESEKGEIDPDKMEKEYLTFLTFWRKAYLKGEDNEVCN